VVLTVKTRTVAYLYFTLDTHYPLLTVQTTSVQTLVDNFPGLVPDSYSENITYLKATALPVTFASFTAFLQNKNVLLQWKTAQEINTHHFNIQRSLTGIDFVTVDAITASSNATGSTYNYNDQTFAKTNVPPSAYYRIQEVDKDGKLFYSGTALVHGGQNIVSLYPNPAGSLIRFSIPNATVADAVVIYDAKGRAVKQWSHYTLTQPAAIGSLSKGTYFIQIKINNKTTTTTFVKE
ncbi:MAG: T9SS type A sorting domain-containing protein, partial [Bacteroidota bacterium]|nr:T9SS type A sorting domain-containing protein [Bacteroidota bacterium]